MKSITSTSPFIPHGATRARLLLLWCLTAVFIPTLSGFGRALQHWTYQHLGETVAAWIIGLMLLGLGAAAVLWLKRRQRARHPLGLLLIAVALVVAFVAILALLPRTEERLHFVTFGLLGFLSGRLYVLPVAVTVLLVGSGADELFQAWLPDRVGDWRDVGMNVAASALGLMLARLGQGGRQPVPSESRERP